MRIASVRGVLLAFLFSLLSAPLAFTQAPDKSAIAAIVEESLKAWEVPGAAVAIVKDDKVVFLQGFGVRELDTDKPVTPDTIFGIASCSKAFTATAIAMLVDEGKMAWDDPVRKHVDFFHLHDPLADENVTLRDLLCHRTGLLRHDLIGHRSPLSREEIIRRIAFLKPTYSFRSTYQYQNLMYLTAGYAAGRADRSSWDELVQRRLFAPLGMTSASSRVKDAEKNPDHALPHKKNGTVKVIPWYSVDNIGPAGSINASARDLTRWLRFQLGDGSFEAKRLVSAKNLAETHAPQMIIPLTGLEKDLNPETMQRSYALGWIVQDYRGQLIWSHTGGLDGFRARIVLVPRAKLGIAILTNSSVGMSGASMHIAATYNLVDLLLGLPKKDWNAYYLDQAEQFVARHRAREKERNAKRHLDTKPSRELDAYAGVYDEPAYGRASITVENGSLVLRWSSFKDRLLHFHYDTFQVKGDDPIAGEEVVFQLDGAGDVARLRFLGVEFKKGK